MKRINNPFDSNFTLIQVKIDNNALIDSFRNHLPLENEAFDLREFIGFLKKNFERDQLNNFQKELNEELSKRNSAIFEKIPDDIWVSVFNLLSHNVNFVHLYKLQEVCKRWKECLPSSITKIRFPKRDRHPIESIETLTSLRSLAITIPTEISQEVFEQSIIPLHELIIHDSDTTSYEVSSESWAQLTSLRKLDYAHVLDAKEDFILNPVSLLLLTSLHTLKISSVFTPGSADSFKSFPHLRALHLHLHEDCDDISKEYFESNYGINLSIIDSLKELQLIKLPRFDFLNCQEIQEKYPHVRFLWKIHEPDSEVEASNSDEVYTPYEDYYVGYYEGPFSANNEREGNSTMWYKDDKNRARYEGTFKNDKREGKGTFFYYDGSKYEGEWKNHLREGKGIEFDSEGWRYEGEFKGNKKEGQGIFFYEDGSRYEGGFQNDVAEGAGVYFFANGNWCEGHTHDFWFEGKAIIHFPNGNRFEGEFKNDKATGRGSLFCANGEKYEGDVEIFDLDNGILKIRS